MERSAKMSPCTYSPQSRYSRCCPIDIRTVDLANRALAEAEGGHAAITSLADDRGILLKWTRVAGPFDLIC